MGSSLHSVQRTALLYTRNDQAVRLEVHETGGVLRLIVLGPGTEQRSFEFPDTASLTTYQVTYERGLLDDGYQLQAIAERRANRRPLPRDVTDRRR